MVVVLDQSNSAHVFSRVTYHTPSDLLADVPGVMDYDEACFMHLTPGVVHNFPKVVGV